MTVMVSAATDVGLKRTQNEDCFGTWVSEDPSDLERRGVLLVVADGMGGSRGGEVASKLAVETVLRSYREAPGEQPLDDLTRAVEAANRLVHGQSLAHPELRGMGTTCTALVVRDREAFLAHVGDSRAYAVRDGLIRQLSRDHSLVAQLVESRQITPEQARIDPRRNLVTRSVGVGNHVEVDAEHVGSALREGDTMILSTDGLHGLVSDEELATHASGDDLDRACRELVALARRRGGHDNITLILARLVSSVQDDPARARERRSPSPPPKPSSGSVF
jgi:protein phosphatase